jgi:hypothetical protein
LTTHLYCRRSVTSQENPKAAMAMPVIAMSIRDEAIQQKRLDYFASGWQ